MGALAAFVGLLLILGCLWEAFETVILPRRVSRRVRLARLFYRYTWRTFRGFANATRGGSDREGFLSLYGPLSLILLLALWAVGLIVGFALLQWGGGTEFSGGEAKPDFGVVLYSSGETFFTLGFGDVAPLSPFGRLLAVLEAGTGFAFLAVVIAYLPVLYQAFAQREVSISLLDARAGSPPCAVELLRRQVTAEDRATLDLFLHEWERWAASLLESHLSYPLLAYFRSQHDRESWVAALTAILDTSALLMVGMSGLASRQAHLTFAMARHVAADLSQVLSQPPVPPDPDRLPPATLLELRRALAEVGLELATGEQTERDLAKLRALYEPYVNALSIYLAMPLPGWLPEPGSRDDWQTTAWRAEGRDA